MLKRIKELIEEKVDFAFETTLSTKSYQSLIMAAKSNGYFVSLVYLWLDSPELAIDRVHMRVEKGGHNIPHDVIIRRYHRGLKNFFTLYSRCVDGWFFYNNSGEAPALIAEGTSVDVQVYNQILWKKLIG